MTRSLKQRRFTSTVVAISIAVAVGLSGCAAPAPVEPEEGFDFPRIHLGMVPGGNINTLPQYVALDQGFFADEGLDVEIIELAGGPQMVAALAARSIEVMANSPSNGMIANAAGQDFVGIVAAFNDPSYALLAQDDWPTPNAGKPYPAALTDLKGAVIGVPVIGSESENITRRMLRDAGLNPDVDVQFVAIGSGQQAIGAFEGNQADVWMANEPGPTILLASDQAKVIVDLRVQDEIPKPFQGWTTSIYQGNREYVDANPEAMAAFEAAITKAIDYIKENPEGALEVYQTMLTLDEDVLSGILDAHLHMFDAKVKCDTWSAMTDFLVEAGRVAAGAEQSCEDFMWSGTSSIE